MQKVSHFAGQMKKITKCQLGHFCPEPFNKYTTISIKISKKNFCGTICYAVHGCSVQSVYESLGYVNLE